MNPLIQEALGSLMRHGLTLLAGYAVSRGIWTAESAATYVTALTLALVGVAWSIWQKYRSRLVLVTALASPRRQSESEVVAVIASGAPVPSVTTPSAVAPVVTG